MLLRGSANVALMNELAGAVAQDPALDAEAGHLCRVMRRQGLRLVCDCGGAGCGACSDWARWTYHETTGYVLLLVVGRYRRFRAEREHYQGEIDADRFAAVRAAAVGQGTLNYTGACGALLMLVNNTVDHLILQFILDPAA